MKLRRFSALSFRNLGARLQRTLLTAVGIVLGSVYGVLGIATILGGQFPLQVTIPWGQIALVLGLALAAGLLASVLPGRRAARTAPAQALASADE